MIAADLYGKLSEQGRALVEDALRFGIVVPVIVAARKGWPAESLRKASDALVAERILNRFKAPGDGRAAYYAFTPGTAAKLGTKAPPRDGYQRRGVIHRLFLTLYVAKHSELAKITSAEFGTYFPQLHWPKANCSHYVIELADPDPPRLGWVIVDDGERDPTRLASKAREEYGKRFERRAWREQWILPGRFFVAIVTGADAKASAIRQAHDEKPLRHARAIIESLESELEFLPNLSSGV